MRIQFVAEDPQWRQPWIVAMSLVMLGLLGWMALEKHRTVEFVVIVIAVVVIVLRHKLVGGKFDSPIE